MEVSTKHLFEDEWLVKALLNYQIIEAGFLEEVRARNADTEYFSEILIKNNHLSLEDISLFVENILQIPYINLDDIEINPAAIKQIPENLCQKYFVFPFNMKDDHIAVAFSNPFNLDAEKELAYVSGKFVKTFFSFKDDIKRKIEEYYSPDKFIDNLVDRAKINTNVQIEGDQDLENESPVIKLVSMILGDAIGQEASDIHIEPKEKNVVVRYRIDGILRNILEVPKSVQTSLVSRIKIISNLNIAESRKPQDGKAKVIHDNTGIDLRISILPTNFGEKVVIRILDNRKARISLTQLGISGKNLELLESCFSKTQGMVLVTGPTGSGKTTTLYAALNRIRNTANNILTIEDPIEYMLEGINQVQVNPKAGITFASALRSFLRQDPDVILVGEIRDLETAEIAVQASLTGHLVLSTLHTNDTFNTITRLIDIGIDIYKIASCLEVIIAQRLLRKLCHQCKEEKKPDNNEKNLIPFISRLGYDPKFYYAKGCPKCSFSGYKGRIGIYEILILNDEIKDHISKGSSLYDIKKLARKEGFRNLYELALKHITDGLTDYQEVMRIVNPTTLKNESESIENKDVTDEKTVSIENKESSFIEIGPENSGQLPPSNEKTAVQPIKVEMDSEISDYEKNRPSTILLVEDNSAMRKMIRVLIEKRTDWKLLEAEDGLVAMKILLDHQADLIVCDIMMPNMDGYEFLSHLRKNLSTATIPVLMLTSLKSSENEIKSLDLGADDYLSKPYNANVLLARIKRLLSRSKIRLTEEENIATEESPKLNLRLL